MRNSGVNESKRVLKSIEPVEEICINISKKVNGKEVDDTLKAVAAFTNTFNDSDKYELTVKVEKIIDKESLVKDDGEAKQ